MISRSKGWRDYCCYIWEVQGFKRNYLLGKWFRRM